MTPTQTGPNPGEWLCDVETLVARCADCIREWERRLPPEQGRATSLPDLLDGLLLHNLKLWQLEDRVRHEGLTDAEVVHTKRLIDLENQARTERVEQIDRALVSHLNRQGVVFPLNAPLHTESPGLILDRLTILVLRIHMLARSMNSPSAPPSRVEEAKTKHDTAKEQLRALIQAAEPTFSDFMGGRRRFFVSSAVKQYGR